MEFCSTSYLDANVVVAGSLQFYIYTRYRLDFRVRSVHEELVKVYRDLAPSFRTVARWMQHFAAGSEGVEDEARAGRPRTSGTDSSVERAAAFTVEDPTITRTFLAFELGVSYVSAPTLSFISSLVVPRGVQDGWQSAANGCKNVNQMTPRGFLMLLRVTSLGFLSSP